MRRLVLLVSLAIAAACSNAPEPPPAAPPANATPAAPALIEIPAAPDQPISRRERLNEALKIDLDAIIKRGYVRILVAPSRTHFQTAGGKHRGRAVDVGVALAAELSRTHAREIAAVFIETREERLVPNLLAGRGDIAANLILTFARDEQVAFAPPIRSGIRELIVSGTRIISLEDIGERAIHVRKNSEHHTSLIRLNEQLKKADRRPARIVVDDQARTDEELLDRVNVGTIPATIVDDYILDVWLKNKPKISVNRDVAVSQDGVLAWVTRKDAPQLIEFLKDFFTAHKLTF